MNDDETSLLHPEHLAKWLRRTREYLFAPRADLGNAEMIESAPCHPVSQFHCSRSVLLSWARWALAHFLKRAAPRAWLIVLGCAGLPLASPAAEPLALQGIMKEMGRNMQTIVDGMSREDYATVEKAALAIAGHPQPPLGEKLRVMAFVGTDAPRYKAFEGETHDKATTLAKVSKNGNGEDAIAAFRRLQSSCLACHQAFRKPFVDHFHGKAEVRQ